jgi:acetolactate synthase-1/3 small subunit
MKHTLVATMDSNPFTFNRVISLFRSRGFAIDSLTIGQTDVPDLMRLTIVVDGSKTAVEQVVKQMYKVVEVRKVSDLSEDQPVMRELAMVKVTSKPSTRAEIMQLVDIYRARIIDVALGSVMIEVTGDPEKIDSMVNLLRGFGIKELVRTGVVAMVRGSSTRETTSSRDGVVAVG